MSLENFPFKLELNEDAHSIGVLFSGGLDSTLLLVLLQLQNRIKQRKLTAFNIENANGYKAHCARILSQPFFAGVDLVSDVPNGGDFSGIIRQGITWVLEQKNLDLVYIGINKNPDFEHERKPVRRTSQELSGIKRLRYPFIDFTKDQLLKIFFQIEEQNNLDVMSLTHSCTTLPVGQCGRCFQCCERQWAFKTINRQDPYLAKTAGT